MRCRCYREGKEFMWFKWRAGSVTDNGDGEGLGVYRLRNSKSKVESTVEEFLRKEIG